MKKVFRSNIYFLIVLLLSIFLQYPLAIIYKSVGLSDIRIALFLNHTILFLIPAIIYVIVTKCNIKETFKINKLHLKDALLLILLAIVAYPFMACFSVITSLFFENNVSNFIGAISSTSYVVLLLLMAVMPAITEEITMRGIVLSGYDNKSKFKASVMIGLLFGIFHLDGQQFLYAAVLGFILAYIVRITKSIFASMLVHFTVNGISVTLSSFLLKGNDYIGQAKEQVDFINTSLDYKLTIISIYLMIAISLGGLIYKLIKVLEKWNNERNIAMGIKEEVDLIDDEKIINLPIIAIVLFYIAYMVLTLYIF